MRALVLAAAALFVFVLFGALGDPSQPTGDLRGSAGDPPVAAGIPGHGFVEENDLTAPCALVARPGLPGRYPALLLLTSALDEPMGRLARALADRGIVVALHDPGGPRAGSASPRHSTRAALVSLATRPDVDATRIGLGGCGKNATLAARLASHPPSPAFALLMALPIASGDVTAAPLRDLQLMRCDGLVLLARDDPDLDASLARRTLRRLQAEASGSWTVQVLTGTESQTLLRLARSADPAERSGARLVGLATRIAGWIHSGEPHPADHSAAPRRSPYPRTRLARSP
jgi:dienelactone hydrolase